MSFTFRRELIVAWGDCDPAGIVFNPRFFEMFDANTWLMFEAALGVKAHALTAVYGIIGIALVDARANFLRPAKFGDRIELASRVSEFRRTSFEVEHRLFVDGALAIEGQEFSRLGGTPRRRSRADHHRPHSGRGHCEIAVAEPGVKTSPVTSPPSLLRAGRCRAAAGRAGRRRL